MRENLLPGVPIVDSPFFDEMTGDFDPKTAAIARDLHINGYAIFDFPDDRFGERADAIIERMRPTFDFVKWKAGKIGLRAQDVWKTDSDIKAIATNSAVIELLSKLYGRRAFPFQTLTFPVGSQQAGHSDHVHFNSVPDRFMCGVWVALEDVDERNGPLFYYPGSHKWPVYENEHIGFDWTRINNNYPNEAAYSRLWEALCEREGITRQPFLAKRGQAVIWASNLIHGGCEQLDLERTRWSQVTHYHFEGCGYTKPLSNDVFARQMVSCEYVNIVTGRKEPTRLSMMTPLRARLKARLRWWEYWR